MILKFCQVLQKQKPPRANQGGKTYSLMTTYYSLQTANYFLPFIPQLYQSTSNGEAMKIEE